MRVGGGGGEVAGSQPMSKAVHRSPNKIKRSNLHIQPMHIAHPSLVSYIRREERVRERGYIGNILDVLADFGGGGGWSQFQRKGHERGFLSIL
jgi:hypothetical protein